MELIEKVLTALKLCQTLECNKCPYLNEVPGCQFQLLARDAETVITALKNVPQTIKDIIFVKKAHENDWFFVKNKDANTTEYYEDILRDIEKILNINLNKED